MIKQELSSITPDTYINPHHLTYDPVDSDLFITGKSGDYQRLIWGQPQDLREREIERWEAFEEFIID